MIGASLAGALLGAAMVAGLNASHAERSAVSTYNDGFSTSKQDDCDQDSTYACEWLGGSR
jgi:hypothetical protein